MDNHDYDVWAQKQYVQWNGTECADTGRFIFNLVGLITVAV